MYMGHEGMYTSTTKFFKNEECNICKIPDTVIFSGSVLLKDVVEKIKSKYKLNKPSLFLRGDFLYVESETFSNYKERLDKTLNELKDEKVLGALTEKAYPVEVIENSISRNIRLIIT